jgi:hypothetical protein
MRWLDACSAYPAQWIVAETSGEELHDVELYADGRAAMYRYRERCHQKPDRAYCFFHTTYPGLELRASGRCVEPISDETTARHSA